MASLLLALVLLACLYVQSLYVLVGGATTATVLFTLWFIARLIESFSGDNTWLKGLKDYSGELICLSLFTLAILFNILFGRGETGYLHLAITSRVLLALFIVCSYSRNPRLTPRTFAFSALCAMGVFAWISIPELINNPLLARSTQYDVDLYEEMLRKGVGRYSVYTADAMAFPCFVAAIATTRGILQKLFLAVLCLGIALAVFLSSYMAAVTTMVLSYVLLIGLSLHAKLMSVKSMAKMLGVIIAASGFIGVGFYFSAGSESFQFSLDKAKNLSKDIAVHGLKNGDETGRYQLMQISLSTFLENPLFGVGPYSGEDTVEMEARIGSHSSLLDQLAEYGIVGFGSYLVLMGLLTRRVFLGIKFGVDQVVARAVAITWAAFCLTGLYNMTVMVHEVAILVFAFVVISSFRHCFTPPSDRRLAGKSSCGYPKMPDACGRIARCVVAQDKQGQLPYSASSIEKE